MCKSHGEVKRVNGKRVPSPEYRTWQAMKNRCYNTRSRDYPYYGGKGVYVCDRWRDSAENFIADMGRRPSEEFTLDRIRSDGPYSPENCRWATRREQARNRPYASTKAWVLAERLGLRPMTVHHMIWQVRAKDRGEDKWFALSPALEKVVRDFMKEMQIG